MSESGAKEAVRAREAAQQSKEAPQAKAPAPSQGVVCVLDLGEHSRRRVRSLRRGEGRLMEKVEDAIAALKEDGVLDASAQTAVVVVRQEAGSFLSNDDDEDDDDDDDDDD